MASAFGKVSFRYFWHLQCTCHSLSHGVRRTGGSPDVARIVPALPKRLFRDETDGRSIACSVTGVDSCLGVAIAF